MYAYANAMVDHNFTDDAAITWAYSKAEAIEKFRKSYGMANKDTVRECKFTWDGICILTDY